MAKTITIIPSIKIVFPITFVYLKEFVITKRLFQSWPTLSPPKSGSCMAIASEAYTETFNKFCPTQNNTNDAEKYSWRR